MKGVLPGVSDLHGLEWVLMYGVRSTPVTPPRPAWPGDALRPEAPRMPSCHMAMAAAMAMSRGHAQG